MKRKFIYNLIFILLICFSLPYIAKADNTDSSKITLDDALKLVETNNSEIVFMNRKIEILEKQYKEAQDRANYAKNALSATPDDEDLAKDAKLNWKQKKYDLDSLKHDKEETIKTLKNDIKKQFANLAALQTEKTNLQEELNNLKTTINQVNQKINLGLLKSSDLKQYEAQQMQLEAQIEAKDREIENAEITLKKDLGIDVSKKVEFVSSALSFTKFDDSNIEDRINKAIENSYDLVKAQTELEIAKITYEIEYDFASNPTDSAVTSAENTVESKQEALDSVKPSLQVTLWSAYNNLKNLEDNIEIEKLNLEVAEIDYKTAEANLKLGKATNLDLVKAKVSYYEQQTKVQSAIDSYMKAVMDFKVQLGEE